MSWHRNPEPVQEKWNEFVIAIAATKEKNNQMGAFSLKRIVEKDKNNTKNII